MTPQTDKAIGDAARAIGNAAADTAALVRDLRGFDPFGVRIGVGVRDLMATTDATIKAIGDVARDLHGSGEVTTGNALRAALGRIGGGR